MTETKKNEVIEVAEEVEEVEKVVKKPSTKAKSEVKPKNDPYLDIHTRISELIKIKLANPKQFARQKELDELGKVAEKYNGPFGIKNQTLCIDTKVIFITENYPNPKDNVKLVKNKKNVDENQYFKI